MSGELERDEFSGELTAKHCISELGCPSGENMWETPKSGCSSSMGDYPNPNDTNPLSDVYVILYIYIYKSIYEVE